MNELETTTNIAEPISSHVFVSYATEDRKHALSICKKIESRGASCWISTRDVAPGENYQEAIVRSIRHAQAMVLVFSEAANKSDEIKKELSLASRFRIPVITLRIENVEPSDAFAYELSTRQWIDALDGWDEAIDSLVNRIEELPDIEAVAAKAASPALRRTALSSQRKMAIAAAGLLLLAMLAGAWWFNKPDTEAPHSMTVRLAGFKLLSPDIPATIPDAVDAEITAAFNQDGVVGVSNATSPATGSAPAYAIGGTIQRDGKTIRVITRLTNERSGTALWSYNFNYDGNETSKVPRRIAVDAGNVVRCGLFGASTYHKPLPDNALRDYMQFCQGYWDPYTREGRKALVPAQRVVKAVPDFSWGWAAVAGAFWKVSSYAETPSSAEEARANGREAADRAIALDAKNSEALYIKSRLIDPQDWLGREALLKRAIAARGLDCGCEHHQYGWMLANVGRISDAVEELQQANDMLALYVYTPLNLADALVAAGKPDQAKRHFDAAIELAPDSAFAKRLTLHKAIVTGDIEPLHDPTSPLSAEQRAALLEGYRAMASGSPESKAQAVSTLVALPREQQNDIVASLLAQLGANHEAFQIAAWLAANKYAGPSIFWYPSMRASLDDPGFPALATQLGLMEYWKTTRKKPDVCNEKTAPSFCKMI